MRVLGGTNQGLKTQIGATALMLIITGAQIIGTGFFIIRITIIGIQYFIVVAATDKATLKNQLVRNFIYGVLWFILAYILAAVLGV